MNYPTLALHIAIQDFTIALNQRLCFHNINILLLINQNIGQRAQKGGLEIYYRLKLNGTIKNVFSKVYF